MNVCLENPNVMLKLRVTIPLDRTRVLVMKALQEMGKSAKVKCIEFRAKEE